MDRQTIEFYLPYYYKPNNIFQEGKHKPNSDFIIDSLN
jgi:hypothetical protein